MTSIAAEEVIEEDQQKNLSNSDENAYKTVNLLILDESQPRNELLNASQLPLDCWNTDKHI